MPLQQTSGNVTQDAYGGGKAVVPVYVENVFSTYLYTGNNTTNNIVNNIDLSTKGGMLWLKSRSNAGSNIIYDTVRGMTTGNSNYLATNLTNAQSNYGDTVSTTSGFTLGANYPSNINSSGYTEVSWTFRKQPNFFDIQTWTGNGTSQNISHNLGSTPGCIIVKNLTSAGYNWIVYHSSLGNSNALFLNTSAASSGSGAWNNTSPTSTQFTVGSNAATNNSGDSFIAYIFGPGGTGGFGLTGTQDIISCGSFTTNGSGNVSVNLGWEPQWIMYKEYDAASGWIIDDTMRGLSYVGEQRLSANSSGGEINVSPGAIVPTATGFNVTNSILPGSTSWIYIAIRRGPMATPTTGTSVFSPVVRAGTSAVASITGIGFVPDVALISPLNGSIGSVDWCLNFFDKLRNPQGYRLSTPFTNAQDTSINFLTSFDESGITFPSIGYNATNGSGYNYINYFFQRAPGFFDEVCWGGSGSSLNHNLGVAPQLIIYKPTSQSGHWSVYCSVVSNALNSYMQLETNNALVNAGTPVWQNITSTTFGFTSYIDYSATGNVAYLFATVTGVSYVGLYSGTGGTQSISCGFGAGGARFILIKRTDSTGDWYVFDSADGLTSSSSPYLLTDSASTQVTGNHGIYASTGGFTLTSASPVNTSGGSFIFLAIA